MIYERRTAVIELDKGYRNRGTVTNIIVGDISNISFSENYALWNCNDYDVAIGDRWENEDFKHPDGANAAPYVSPEQLQIDALQAKNIELEQAALDNAEMILDLQTVQLGGNA